MKIYRILPDVNNYQYFLPEDEAVWSTQQLFFDCSTKATEWRPPEVYILKPKHKRGNFLRLGPGSFVVDSVATEELRDLLEQSGELLPLIHKGEKFYVVNVTECINVLDETKTEWEQTPEG